MDSPSDDTAIEAALGFVLDETYDALSFGAGGVPDWDRFGRHFLPSAVLVVRLFPDDAELSTFDLAGYTTAQLRPDLAAAGYREEPGSRRTAITGRVATIEQEFTMHFPDGREAAAVDHFSFAVVDGRWKIVSVVCDLAR